ncbi:MAG: peroxide stress protein YaaA [Flavobacteriaceae bacterium]|nr:peroxide stress protein YaaA [Flavobacteriaceae bacterium]
MKIIISPAKSLDFKTELPTKNFSTPNFLSESKKINELLKKKSPSELKSLMSISEKLAELNWNRNNTFKTPFNIENARPSIFTFNGDVYSGLDAFSLSMDQLNQAQKSLRILSGLYGLLKPLDLIQPYRLEMGTKLNIEGSLNLYGFWKNKITNKLNDELNQNEFFVNLASNEYSSAIDRKLLKTTMISPSFKDMKNGKLKIISFYAKKARGMMVRYILDNEINNLEDLKGFDYGGYSYSSEESEKMKELVFIR